MCMSISPEIAFQPGLPVATRHSFKAILCRTRGQNVRDCFTPVESNEGKQGRAKQFLTPKRKKYRSR